MLDELNLSARCWLDGQAGGPTDVPSAMTDGSPVWTRVWGSPQTVDCKLLDDVLGKLGAKRMVVGHTVQKAGVTSICDGSVWRIDVGLAAYYGDAPVSILEVKAGQVRVLTAPG